MGKYKATIITLIIGFVLFGLTVFFGIRHFTSSTIEYVDLGDTQSVNLDKGKYMIFLDEHSAFNHDVRENEDSLSLDVQVNGNGEMNQYNLTIERLANAIPINDLGNTTIHTSYGNKSFEGIGTVEIKQSGKYTIAVENVYTSLDDYDGEIMLTNLSILEIILTIFLGIGIIGVTGVTALILFLRTRSKNNQLNN